MKVRELLNKWASSSEHHKTLETMQIGIPLKDAARLEALVALYPGLSKEQMLSQIISSALEEIETAMPYVPGPRVVAQDEMGDPLYEDIGPTPRYLALRAAYLQRQQMGKPNTKKAS
ncbi:MAG: type 1 pili tip component [Oceanospirillaceae bacterium]|nr:type 1 pili tip component [Oceanospirillaceae bacterium]MCP5349754.1 type 1 pili tip component [Oceanospirillaceae bacterium]